MADVLRLAGFLGLDAPAIQQQEWSRILPSLLLKATEFEELQSKNVMMEVEIEQAQVHAEKRVSEAEEQSRIAQAELSHLRSSDSSSNSRLQTLQAQVVSFESERHSTALKIRVLVKQNEELAEEKRQALALVDRQSQAATRSELDYKSLMERYQLLRKDTASLESQVSEVHSVANSAQFKNTSLEQSISLLEKNVQYLNEELTTKTSQFSTYRKENAILLTTLQQEVDVIKSHSASSEHNETLLRQRNEELAATVERNLLRISELQDDMSNKEESFRLEMATQSRLVDLYERSSKDAKKRISQLERSIELRSDSEMQDFAKFKEIAETSQQHCRELELRVGHYEDDLQGLQRELDLANERLGATSNTTANGIGLLSPSAHVISKVYDAGMSLTQLYAELLKSKQDLEHERRKNNQIQQGFDDLIAELESRAPQIQQQREEYSSLQYELASMSENMQKMTERNESLTRELTTCQILAKDRALESEVHEQQVTDLSRQVQNLLFEIEEQGFRANPLSDAEVTALNRMLENQISGGSAVDNLISDRLVLFKNIQDLQIQNQQQLKVTRQLGAKMEREEEENRNNLNNLESTALTEAGTVITNLSTEIQSMKIKMDSYVRERDMFRNMLPFGDTHTTATIDDTPHLDISHTSFTDKYTELQKEYDIYKRESILDQQTLHDKLAVVQRERSDMSLQVARLGTQLELAEERHKMLKGSVDSMQREVEESRRRASQIQENMAKQEYRCQHNAEEIADTKALLESVRHENANYRAEKQLWRSIEKRMADEIDAIRIERDRLNNLVASLQATQSERDRTERDNIQRHTHQIQSLESELEASKTQLNYEREEVKRLNINRDQAARESHEKIESLLRQVSEAREACAIATTAGESQSQRVAELNLQLQAAQQRVSILSQSTNVRGSDTRGTSDGELHLQVTDLQVALEHSKHDLKLQEDRAQHMQEVAEASEKALQDMNKTYDTYKSSHQEEAHAQSLASDRLESQIRDLTTQLSAVNEELAQIHRTELEKRQTLQAEVDLLRGQVDSLREVEEKYSIATSFYQDDLRSQAEIAQDAQQNYENELMKHAEAAQALRTLRLEYNELRSEVLSLRHETSNSEKRIAEDNKTWQNQKNLYERETLELRARLTDLRRQNELLHDQFETFSAQMSHAGRELNETVADQDVEGIQEVVKYLRREKEIIEVSFEVIQQENKRMKQQLSHTVKSLDEVQASLTMERQRSAQMTVNATELEELKSKSNELSIVRESNGTLRAENEAKLVKLRSLEVELSAVQERMQPLESQVRFALAESQAKTEEIALLTQDNERWRQRNQAILQKYERIDPAELQQLREQAAGATEQLQELRRSVSALEAQVLERDASISSLQEQLSGQNSRYDALMQQSKDRIKKERTEAKKALATAQASSEQLESQAEQITNLQMEVNNLMAAVADQTLTETLQAKVAALELQLTQSNTTSQTQKESLDAEVSALNSIIETMTNERASTTAVHAAEDSKDDTKMQEVQAELKKLQVELEQQKTNFTRLRAVAKKNKDELATATANITSLTEELEPLRIQLVSAGDGNVSEAEIQQRIEEAVSRATTQVSQGHDISPETLVVNDNHSLDDAEVRQKVAAALAEQALLHESEKQRLVAEALASKTPAESSAVSAVANDEAIAEIIKSKDEECKSRIRSITKEKVDALVDVRLPKKIEAERQNWLKVAEAEKTEALAAKDAEMQKVLKELEEKNREALETRVVNVRKESDMRNQLKIGMKDKKIAKLEETIAGLTSGSDDKLATTTTTTPAVTDPQTTTQSTTTATAASEAAKNGDHGKSPDPFNDTSEQSEGDLESAQASGIETPDAVQQVGKADVPNTRSRGGGRGGRQQQQRGGKRGGAGGHQGTKRPREEAGGTGTEGEQPSKKAAAS